MKTCNIRLGGSLSQFFTKTFALIYLMNLSLLSPQLFGSRMYTEQIQNDEQPNYERCSYGCFIRSALGGFYCSNVSKPVSDGCFIPHSFRLRQIRKSAFQAGALIGVFFANKYTTALYDGYGYDANGKRNDFWNPDLEKSSFMYRRIVWDYGGGNGQADLIAQALGVQPGEWSFDESDMPKKMKYNPALITGTQLLYAFTKNDAVLLNVHAAKLTVSGVFTIVIKPPIGPLPPEYQNIKTFSITGAEQRLLFQLGYRRVFGDTDEGLNFFVEAGAVLNMAKFSKNQITINTLQIDLATYYTNPYYPTYRAKFLNGIGYGAFAGFGLNLRANLRWDVQLIYLPSYEKINIGADPKNKLQNEMGLRALYKFSR